MGQARKEWRYPSNIAYAVDWLSADEWLILVVTFSLSHA
jgi:hypothetical protein